MPCGVYGILPCKGNRSMWRWPILSVFLLALAVAVGLSALRTLRVQSGDLCFTPTGQCIRGPIRAYWERHGGLAMFGFPITPQMQETVEGRLVQVQWFERDRLEIQPDGRITAGRLGVERLAQLGMPWRPGPGHPAGPGCETFVETGHQVCGAFLAFWYAHGGLERFGLPITGAFETVLEGRTLTVQYFERRRFELHPDLGPDTVLLGLLGREVLDWRTAETSPPVPSRPTGLPSGRVVRVVDGDTADVRIGAEVERVRLIGINAPESADPRREVECFGPEAAAKAAELLRRQTVFLEADPTQGDRDRFGRLLRYLWLTDGRMVNYELVANGYAYEYTFDAPYRYQALFKAAESRAREQGRGLWAPGVCD